MSPAKSAVAGLAVGLIAYFGASWLGAKPMAQIGLGVAPTLAPTATEVPKRGTDFGTNSGQGAKKLAPALAPTGTTVAPTPSVSVTPRVSTPSVSSQSPAPSATPRISVVPNPTPASSPTPTPTPSLSLIPTPTPTATASPTATPTAAPTESPTSTPTPVGTSLVVINEIAWAGTKASQYGEWIELFNSGNEVADLTGWAIYKTSGVKLIDLSGTIAPGAYFLIERTTASSPDPISDIQSDVSGPFGGSGLRNLPGGEDLSLRDAGGVTVDSVPCSGGWFAGAAGPDYATMERIDASLPGSDASNWAPNTGLITTGSDAAGAPLRGTPKFKNSVTP